MNLTHAQMIVTDMLENIIAARHSKPAFKEIHVEDAQHQLEKLARELGYRVERLPAPVKEVA